MRVFSVAVLIGLSALPVATFAAEPSTSTPPTVEPTRPENASQKTSPKTSQQTSQKTSESAPKSDAKPEGAKSDLDKEAEKATAAAAATDAPKPVDEEKLPPAPTNADKKGSPQRFTPSEQVRADFDVSFPIDI